MSKIMIYSAVILLALLIVGLLLCFQAGVLMLAWNLIMPIFNVTTLSFLQSIGLSIIINIIASMFNRKTYSYEEIESIIKELRNYDKK